MVELKPCPFCGAEADDSVPYAAAIVHKPKCFFREVPHGKRGIHGFGEHTPPEAIEAWNTRTPEQAVAATLGSGWVGKPFVEYAEHVAEELYDEAFSLLEGCDEPDFSAIDSICASCSDIARAAKTWKSGEPQAVAATLGSDDSARWHELFGTPERAAETVTALKCCDYSCDGCPLESCDCTLDSGKTLEWLRGKAVKR